MAKNDTEWGLLHMIFGMTMSQGQTITVSSFDNYNSSLKISTAWKTVKIAIFMAFYGRRKTLDDDGFHLIFDMNKSQSQTITVWLFATFCSCFFNINDLKNCENGRFNGILRQKMTLNEDCFTWFLEWACPKAKPSLFHCLITITAV